MLKIVYIYVVCWAQIVSIYQYKTNHNLTHLIKQGRLLNLNPIILCWILLGLWVMSKIANLIRNIVLWPLVM
jgi:hypothetical protein